MLDLLRKIPRPAFLRRLIKRARHECYYPFALVKNSLALRLGKTPGSHDLPGTLIVSLTSYPPRFHKLDRNLKSLLAQNTAPDRVILWIAHEDRDQVPARIEKLSKYGLEIRTCEDTGPYKKLIPALEACPDAFVVTADDDFMYRSDWLQSLIAEWDGKTRQIVCHRAHKIELDDSGWPLPYRIWDFQIAGPQQAVDVFPTSGGGVLYPPGALHDDVTDMQTALKLAPRADDIWYYWMGRRQGCVFQKTGNNTRLRRIPTREQEGLEHENLWQDGNDNKIKAMISYYGWFNVAHDVG